MSTKLPLVWSMMKRIAPLRLAEKWWELALSRQLQG